MYVAPALTVLQLFLFVSFLPVCSKRNPINFLETMWDNAIITNLLQTFALDYDADKHQNKEKLSYTPSSENDDKKEYIDHNVSNENITV
jgi:hypothetical protein